METFIFIKFSIMGGGGLVNFNKKFLVLLLCIIILPASYASNITSDNNSISVTNGDMGIKIISKNMGTANSWFQPVVYQKTKHFAYVWILNGIVQYTAKSKKWPGLYGDSGGTSAVAPSVYAKKYRDSYIKKVKLFLMWTTISGPTGPRTDNEVHSISMTFENVNGELKVVNEEETVVTLNQKQKIKELISNKN